MLPKCSPRLMLTLPQQSNATSCFLGGTSLQSKLNADSQWLPWGSSLSWCPSTCSNRLSSLICKIQLLTSTLQPSSCCISSNAHLHLVIRLRAWSWSPVFPWFGISFQFLESLGCLSCKCWIESVPFARRSWPHVPSQIFFSDNNGCLEGSWWADCHRSCFFICFTHPSRRHTAEPFTTQQPFGWIHIQSQSQVCNGPHALFLLVKLLWSAAASYIHVKTMQFSAEKKKRLYIEVCTPPCFCRKHFPHNGWTAHL